MAKKKMKHGTKINKLGIFIRAVALFLVGTLIISEIACKDREEKQSLARGETVARADTIPEGMALIPEGEFDMGSPIGQGEADEYPQHRVRINAFYMDKYEVTNAQFCELLNAEGNQEEGGVTWLDIHDEHCLIEKHGARFYPKSGYANCPVAEVSWYGACAYARWVGKCLPTEAEWEYACRAGTKTWFNVGKTISRNDANYCGMDAGGRWEGVAPVGSFSPNAWGLYDMHGNVWEWCQDWYGKDYYKHSPSLNPKGPSEGSVRVARGGSWLSISDAFVVRSANRVAFAPVTRHGDLGFRCISDLGHPHAISRHDPSLKN